MKKPLLFLIVGMLLLVACGGDASESGNTSNSESSDSKKKQMSYETDMTPEEAIAIVKTYIGENCEPDSPYIEFPDFFMADTTMGGLTVYYRGSPNGLSNGEWQVRDSTKTVTPIWDEAC